VSRDSVVILTGYRARHHAKLVAVMEALAAMDAASAGRRVVLSSGADCVATAVSKGPAVSEIQNIVDLDIRDWKEGDTGVIAAASAQYGCLGPFIVRSALRWGIAGREKFLNIRCEDLRDTLGRDETSNKIYTGLDAETHSVSDAFGALFAAGAVIAREKMFGNRDWARDFYTKLFGDWVNQNRGNLGTEVVLLFRPDCSPVKVDQGFFSGCHSHGFGLVGMDLIRGQDAMGRVGPLGIVIGQPFSNVASSL
jgi:hypothetical protein